MISIFKHISRSISSSAWLWLRAAAAAHSASSRTTWTSCTAYTARHSEKDVSASNCRELREYHVGFIYLKFWFSLLPFHGASSFSDNRLCDDICSSRVSTERSCRANSSSECRGGTHHWVTMTHGSTTLVVCTVRHSTSTIEVSVLVQGLLWLFTRIGMRR